MMKSMVEFYREMTKRYFNEEAEFKQKFQLQTVEWSYYGQYSGASRFFVVFPIKHGVRVMIEIRKDPYIRNVIKKLLREWEESVKTKNYERYQWLTRQIFETAIANCVNAFREEMEGDVLIRKRIQIKK